MGGFQTMTAIMLLAGDIVGKVFYILCVVMELLMLEWTAVLSKKNVNLNSWPWKQKT